MTAWTEDDIRDRVVRYFANDLDAVERDEVETHLEQNAYLSEHFWAAYDEAVEKDGLLALVSPSADLEECFSSETLRRYVAGELSGQQATWVEQHKMCPVCEQQLTALRSTARSGRTWPLWTRGLAAAVAAGLALIMLIRPAPPPIEPLQFVLTQASGEASRQGPAATDIQTIRLQTGTRLALTFEAAAPLGAAPIVRAFVMGGPSVKQWYPKIAAGPSLVSVSGVVGEELVLGPGEWRVVVVLAYRSEDVDPESVRAAAMGQAVNRTSSAQYFVVDVERME